MEGTYNKIMEVTSNKTLDKTSSKTLEITEEHVQIMYNVLMTLNLEIIICSSLEMVEGLISLITITMKLLELI